MGFFFLKIGVMYLIRKRLDWRIVLFLLAGSCRASVAMIIFVITVQHSLCPTKVLRTAEEV